MRIENYIYNQIRMNKHLIYLFIIISVLFTSCISVRDLVYLQKKDNSSSGTIAMVESKPYRLQTQDVLSITIKASDPKLVAIFNPTSDGLTGGQSASGLYYNVLQ